MNQHITPDRFLEYIDGTLGAPDRSRVDEHLASCSSCRTAFRDFQLLDRSLHNIPLQKTSRGFTGSVMSRVLSGGKEPFTFRILTGIAYAFAMLIVLVILGGVFVLTGVIDIESGSGGGSRIQSVFDATSSTLAPIPAMITAWIREYIPFVFGSGSFGITAAIFGVVMMLFVFDRLVGGRIVSRLK